MSKIINKDILKKPRIKYALIGFFIGILIYVYGIFTYTTSFGEIFINVLIFLPFKLYLTIYKSLNLCPGCVDEVFALTLITMPMYLGFLGFLVGFIIEKIKKK